MAVNYQECATAIREMIGQIKAVDASKDGGLDWYISKLSEALRLLAESERLYFENAPISVRLVTYSEIQCNAATIIQLAQFFNVAGCVRVVNTMARVVCNLTS